MNSDLDPTELEVKSNKTRDVNKNHLIRYVPTHISLFFGMTLPKQTSYDNALEIETTELWKQSCGHLTVHKCTYKAQECLVITTKVLSFKWSCILFIKK